VPVYSAEDGPPADQGASAGVSSASFFKGEL
jgi:hypothetical protein